MFFAFPTRVVAKSNETFVVDGATARADKRDIRCVCAAVRDVICVEQFTPTTAKRRSKGVRDWCVREVARDRDGRVFRPCTSKECDLPLWRGVGPKPLKAVGVTIQCMQRGHGSVKVVEVAHEELNSAVKPRLRSVNTRKPQQVPVEASILLPLGPLRKLTAHEKEFLSGMRKLVAVEATQSSEPLRIGARQFGHERALEVHDLIVREREDEPFVERKPRGKRQIPREAMAILWFSLKVSQRVVHPPHVPLKVEAKGRHASAFETRRAMDWSRWVCAVNDPAFASGYRFENSVWCRTASTPCHPLVRRRLLGEGQRVRHLTVDDGVKATQEVNGFVVFRGAANVRSPVFGGTAMVKPDHRRNRVDAYAVDVVVLKPM
jgi:hypothetical protein